MTERRHVHALRHFLSGPKKSSKKLRISSYRQRRAGCVSPADTTMKQYDAALINNHMWPDVERRCDTSPLPDQ